MCTVRRMRTVVLIPLAVALLAGCSSAASDNTASTTTTKAPKAKAASPAAGPGFPGRKKHDVSVKPGAAVQLSGWTTTAGPLKKITDPAFGKQVCTAVTMTNRDSKTQSYNLLSWKMQSPGGDVKDTAINETNNSFGSGELAPGGKKSGRLCFDDPGAHGVAVVFWQPDLFSSEARAAWVGTV